MEIRSSINQIKHSQDSQVDKIKYRKQYQRLKKMLSDLFYSERNEDKISNHDNNIQEFQDMIKRLKLRLHGAENEPRLKTEVSKVYSMKSWQKIPKYKKI